MTKENNDRFVLKRKILLRMLPFIKSTVFILSSLLAVWITHKSSDWNSPYSSLKSPLPTLCIHQGESAFFADRAVENLLCNPRIYLSFSLSPPPPFYCVLFSSPLPRESSLLRRISDAISVIRGVPDISKERPLGSNHGKHCCATGRHSEVQSICFFFNL